MPQTLTETLISYVRNTEFETIPGHAISVQKKSLADLLAVILAATRLDEAGNAVTRFAAAQGNGPCTLLGSSQKTTPMLAALANGAYAHALDYEDSHEKATVHPNSASFPALMALSQSTGNISGKDFLTASVIASDICCRLDLGADEDLLKYGWNMPPIHGSMGAVMGAGKLLGLTKDQISDAIALNLCQCTCTGEAANSKKSVLRTVREGFAAESAVKSVLLALSGVKAGLETPFEGKLGYYHMYARDHYTPEKITDGLGKRFESEFISFKPWPCCRATHTSIEAALNLMKEHGIRADEIQSIHIVMQEIGKMVFEPAEVKYRPKSPSIAKFSMPFLLGTVMKYGEVTLESFSPERLSNPDILSLGDKVTCEFDPSLTKEQNKYTDFIMKTTKGTFKTHMEYPLGCIENPMSEDQMKEKFFQCSSLASKGYDRGRLEAIYDLIASLEEVKDMKELFDLL